jgi:hypothetical protein
MSPGFGVLTLVAAAALALAIGALVAAVATLAWNLVAASFGLPQTTFWLTWPIMFLVGLVVRAVVRS